MFSSRSIFFVSTFTVLLSSLLSGCGIASYSTVFDDTPSLNDSTPMLSSSAMVVTANPHATQAGLEILRAGGSAVDAAVAIQAVLSLVEPQSSGLAGGAFMVHYDNISKDVIVYDGREIAPMAAKSDMFMLDSDTRMGFIQAKTSGISTGVPGVVAMLEMAHLEQGQLPWPGLFDYAYDLAVNGFEISPRLHSMLKRFGKYIPRHVSEGPVEAFNYFYDEQGQAYPIGHVLVNSDYATTLARIAAEPRSFYTGQIARDIVSMVRQSPRAGALSMADMAAYRPVRHQALCQTYRNNQICGAPPPSSWVAVGMIMGLLEHGPEFSETGASDPKNWSILAQAQQLAYADRDRYIADPNFVDIPLQGMLNADYLMQRAELINPSSASQSTPVAGDPWPFNATPKTVSNGIDDANDVQGTTHFVVVDNQGDVVSMTASVESVFGTTRMAGGMFLNNQLTDFSFRSKDAQGQPIANAVAGGKRPRSSMSPSIVLDAKRNFVLATGSPGGNNIIAYTVKTLVGVFEWGLSPQAAVDLPNMVARGKTVRLEKDVAPASLVDGMRELGFDVDASRGENSGLSVIKRHTDGSLEGAVDKRREGVIGEHHIMRQK